MLHGFSQHRVDDPLRLDYLKKVKGSGRGNAALVSDSSVLTASRGNLHDLFPYLYRKKPWPMWPSGCNRHRISWDGGFA